MKRAPFFLLGFFLTGHGLQAQVENGFYVEFDAGISLIGDEESPDGNVIAIPENGTNFGGAIGYRFLHHYRGEINASHRTADIRFSGTNLKGVGEDLELTSVVANLYYDFDYSSDQRPYLGLGGGRTDGPNEPSWNLMAGASYRIHERIDLKLGYRYLRVHQKDEDVTSNEFLIGVRFNF